MNRYRLVQHVLQAQELVLHLAADERIEGGERLVEEPELGPHRERAGDSDALLLPAGELARVIALAAFEADELDHLAGTGLPRAAVDALDLERKGDVLQHRAVGQQREVLKHHAHLVAAQLRQLPVGRLEQVLALEHDRAGGGLDQAREAAEQRGLAGAREPHDHQDLAGVDLQRGITHGGDVALFQNGGEAGRAPVPVHERPGFGAEQLPDAAAGQNWLGQVSSPPLRRSMGRCPALSARRPGAGGAGRNYRVPVLCAGRGVK